MPSGGGGKKGGGGSVSSPTISIPPGLLQSLNSIQGLGQYGTNALDTFANLGNWAAGIATGGQNTPIGSFGEEGLQTGPTVQIGTGGPQGHDAWSTSFNPQTGQVTFTNSQTGGTFQEAINNSLTEAYIPADLRQQWANLYQNRGQAGSGLNPFDGGGNTGPGGVSQNWFNSLGPSLQSAWSQIQSIPAIEQETQAFTNNETLQGQQLYDQGQFLFNKATTGSGLFPSQAAFVRQGVEAEQSQLGQQLAAEGLGSSTANAILRGEAAQQGAATAGQLIQGNISAAQQQINLAQSAQKLALGGQTLQLGEAQAMAGLAAGFQAQTWQEAMQSYQTLGQMMSTTGALYGIDVTGYSNMLQAEISQGQLSLEAALGNAQAAIGGMQSLGSGLGAIFGNQGLSGLLGGFGGAGGAAGGVASAVSGAGGAAGFGANILQGVGGAAGAAGGAGGLFSGLFSGLGSAGGAIVSAIGGLLAFL